MNRKSSDHLRILIHCILLSLLFLAPVPADTRPARHHQFSEGFRAYKQQKWQEAADLMWQAQQHWPEDGQLTRTYGRWFEAYYPRFYLGVALYELGCYKEALHQFDESMVGELQITDSEREKLESLKLKCDRYVRLGIESNGDADCSKWHI